MDYLAYIVTGAGPVIRRGVTRDPAAWKPVAVADVLNENTPAYRFQLLDNSPAAGGIVIWDTDDIIGITGADRDEAEADGARRLAERRATHTEAAKRGFVMRDPSTLIPADDVEARLRADTEAHARQVAQLRQIDTASMLARHARELHDAMDGLDKEDDAAAYHAAEYSFVRAASSTEALGWPLDGNGVPLPECKDEA
jgi:hypothetical protein